MRDRTHAVNRHVFTVDAEAVREPIRILVECAREQPRLDDVDAPAPTLDILDKFGCRSDQAEVMQFVREFLLTEAEC